MFSISRETDYALNAVFYLSNKSDYVSVLDVSENLMIPKNYLAKIFSKLAFNKILKSREGKSGGYILNKKLNEVSLFDFFSLFEENLSIVRCGNGKICDRSKVCYHRKFFQNYLSGVLKKELQEKTLQDIYNYN